MTLSYISTTVIKPKKVNWLMSGQDSWLRNLKWLPFCPEANVANPKPKIKDDFLLYYLG